jgi:hypothetical protein
MIDGSFGRDQAVGVWALLFASMVTIRALARNMARALSAEERCLVLGDAETANWIMRRFHEAPGLKARVVRRAPLDLVPGSNGDSRHNGHNGHNGDELEHLLSAEHVERAIIAPRGGISDDLLNTTRTLKAMGLRVSVLPRLPARSWARPSSWTTWTGSPCLDASVRPAAPRGASSARSTSSAPVILLGSPLLLAAIAIAIKPNPGVPSSSGRGAWASTVSRSRCSSSAPWLTVPKRRSPPS